MSASPENSTASSLQLYLADDIIKLSKGKIDKQNFERRQFPC